MEPTTVTEPSVKKSNPGLMYGLIAGLVFILITLGQYLGGVQAFMSPVGFLSYAVIIVIAVLAGLKQRKTLGYLPYSEALKITFTVFAIALLLQTLFVYLLFNYIDIPFREAMNQEIMIKTEDMMKRFGASENQIDQALKNQANSNSYGLGKVLLGYCVWCIVLFVVALIVSAFIQKRKPVF